MVERSVRSTERSKMALEGRMGNRMERFGGGSNASAFAVRSRMTLERRTRNRMERFVESRKGGRAFERSRRFP